MIDDVVKAEKKIEKKARETKAKEKVKVEKKRAAAAFRVEKKVKRNVSALKKKTVSKKTDVLKRSLRKPALLIRSISALTRIKRIGSTATRPDLSIFGNTASLSQVSGWMISE